MVSGVKVSTSAHIDNTEDRQTQTRQSQVKQVKKLDSMGTDHASITQAIAQAAVNTAKVAVQAMTVAVCD